MVITDNKTNHATGTVGKKPDLTGPFFQAKLTINDPGDEYEQEADAMADKVMRMPVHDRSFFSPVSANISHLQRKCAHCEEEEKLQRSETGNHPITDITASVHKTLGSSGQSLDKSTRSYMEQRFGYDFNDVQIHSDSLAHQSSSEINALAFTHDNHIVFGEGQYQPGTDSGKRLLAHELTHVIQQDNYLNKTNSQLSKNGPFFIQRKPVSYCPVSAGSIQNNLNQIDPIDINYLPTGIITRPQFDFFVKQRYCVKEVKNGLQAEQEAEIARGTPPVSIVNWQDWSPGGSSEDYTHIIEAIEDVSNTFGGVPFISTILFYEKEYEVKNGVVVAKPTEGASFGAGVLTIYRSFSREHGFPVARSVTHGSYPHVTAAISSPGSEAGAHVAATSYTDYIHLTIAHELGHGIGEDVANRLSHNVFVDFNKEVGWVSGRLFDIQEQPVAAAITAGQIPPAQFEITENHWNDPKWKEQPLSYYSIKGGPSEDFAESIAAYIYSNAVLKSRSAQRYKFINDRIAGWQAALRTIPPLLNRSPMGDYPEPDKANIPA
jgi:hypothetical protein